MRCAIYVRVSTIEQAQEGYSIKAQLERLNAYALSQGWIVSKTYIDDGESAKDMNRTNLTKMLKEMKDDLFDVVLVYKLDRLTRSVLDLYKMLEIFEKHNVKFKSATEVYDTTNAMGRLFITLVAALAQWERENLSERVTMGMEQKAKEGKWVVNLAPIGFDIDGDYLKINEKEAAIVREIFDMYLSNKYGTGKIARILNQRGIKTKSGAVWNDGTIRYVLTNKIYIGTMRYNYRVNKENYFEKENVVDAIISKEDFEEVQMILKHRSKHHPRKATSPYIFTSVLKCARCGSIMQGKQGGAVRSNNLSYQYQCVNHKKGLCDLPNVSQNHLELRFMELIENWQYKHLITDELSNNRPQDDNKERLKQLDRELSEINERRKKWQYAWANKILNDKDLIERNKEEDALEEHVKSEISKLKQNQNETSKHESIAHALNDLKVNWYTLELHEKKKSVEMLVDEIIVEKVGLRRPESVVIKEIKFL